MVSLLFYYIEIDLAYICDMNQTYQVGSKLSVKEIPLLPKAKTALVVDGLKVISQVAIDTVVTKNSDNLITSGAVYKAIQEGISQSKLSHLHDPAIGAGASYLYELNDVVINNPQADQLLKFNGTSWVNATVALTSTLGELTDVEDYTTGNPLAGETIIWQGGDYPTGSWVFMVPPAPALLSYIGDVDNGVPAAGYVLTYNGSLWIGQSAGASHTLTSHNDYTLTPTGTISNLWGWDDTIHPTATLGQNSILIRTNASEWVPINLETVISDHDHVYTEIANWNSGVYNWMNSNLIQGTGISLVKNGTTVVVNNAMTTIGSLADVTDYATNDPLAGWTLVWQGGDYPIGQWDFQPVTIANLTSVGDVTNSPTTGWFLQFNGSSWVTANPASSHSILTHQYVADTAPLGTLDAQFAGYYGGGAAANHILIKTNYATYDEWTTLDLASYMTATISGISHPWVQGSGVVYNTASNIGIGTSAPQRKFHLSVDGITPAAALIGSTDHLIVSQESNGYGISGLVAGSVSTHRAVFKGVRARGTLAAPTVPALDDYVLTLLGSIYDGVTQHGTASVDFFVDGTVSGGVAPQRIVFQTSETNMGARVHRLIIKADGRIGINNTDIESWNLTNYSAIEFPQSAIMYAQTQTNGYIALSSNTYYDGVWKYKTTNKVANMALNSGGVGFSVAASGTIDTAVTWNSAFGISNEGHFGVGKAHSTLLSWSTDYRAFQSDGFGYMMFARTSVVPSFNAGYNSYWDGVSWKYMTNGTAGNINLNETSGIHLRVGISGAAGGGITWRTALRVDTSGTISFPYPTGIAGGDGTDEILLKSNTTDELVKLGIGGGLSVVGGNLTADVVKLSDLSDVNAYATNDPMAGWVLTWQGGDYPTGSWDFQPISMANLTTIGDVTNSPTTGWYLQFNGSSWVTANPATSHSILTHQYVADTSPLGTLDAQFAGYYGGGAGANHILIKTNYATYDEWTTLNLASYMTDTISGISHPWVQGSGVLYNTASNIGIGLIAPQTKLHVSADGSTPASSIIRGTADVLFSNVEDYMELQLLAAGSVAAQRGILSFVRAKGTLASPTTVANGDYLGNIVASGYDGTSLRTMGSIEFMVDGAVSTNNVPTAIWFQTGSTGSRATRMAIDSSGKVAINLPPTPAAWLHVYENVDNALLARFEGAGTEYVNIYDYGVSGYRLNGIYIRNTRASSKLYLETRNAGDTAYHTVYLDGTNGRVGLLNTAPAYSVDVTGTLRVSLQIRADQGIILRGTTNAEIDYDTTNSTMDFFAAGNLYSDAVTDKGYAPDWIATSDARLKKDIEYHPDGWLPVISEIGKKAVRYNWKESYGTSEREIGFIAQDIIEYMPEVVSMGGKGYYGISYDKMVAPLYSGVAELVEENRKLKSQIHHLQCQIDDLKQ